MAYASDGGAAHGRDGWVAREAAGPFNPLTSAPVRVEQLSLAARRGLALCPEIDCIRGRYPPGVLAEAERRAGALGVGADQVLVAAGGLTSDAYVMALAASLGLPFETLDDVERTQCPIGDDALVQAASGGMLLVQTSEGRTWVVAPEGLAARHLVHQVRAYPHVRRALRVTTPDRLRRFVHRTCGKEIGWRATDELRTFDPHLSAAPRDSRWISLWMLWISAFIACAWILPGVTATAWQIAVTVAFIGWTALRLFGALQTPPSRPVERVHDAELPVYSVIIALYREHAAVPGLVRALAGLNYPHEKLDIKFVVEADDPRTCAVLEAHRGELAFELIEAPSIGPRTKPKALNAALPFARGTVTVVFDAEDRPEPNQLRRALAAFAKDVAFANGSGELACVQARLAIDNANDSWLARLFTAEYAGLFDVLLPGLAARDLPIPLGGSSNHFRTDILRGVGGWDPFNVTEDADLGTRLARFGYRTTVIASTTYEEAPATLKPWLKQRTRWFKGWLQTWFVHMRQPLRLVRELGLLGFVTFQLLLVGTVFAALVQPYALLMGLDALLLGALNFEPAFNLPGLTWLHGAAMGSGYLVSIILAVAGLKRRRLLSARWLLVLPPLMVAYWALLSVAAWRALYQFVFDRYRWEKTEHGLARVPRRSESVRMRYR